MILDDEKIFTDAIENLADYKKIDLGIRTDDGKILYFANKNVGSYTPEDYGMRFNFENTSNINDYISKEWRLPTKKELEKLLSNCKISYIADNKRIEYSLYKYSYNNFKNINGFILTGINGNEIYIPTSGIGFSNPGSSTFNLEYNNREGFLWCNNMNSSKMYDDIRFVLALKMSDVGIHFCNTCHYLPVRCVCEE